MNGWFVPFDLLFNSGDTMRFLSFFATVALLALSTTSQASPDIDFPQPGQSYGGKVRSGPGMQYRQVGSLREGNPILILNGTGDLMNGYEWFQIRYSNGSVGYQWGGIMCSQKPHPGIFQVCQGLQSPAGQTVDTTPPPPQPSRVNGYNVVVVNHDGGGFVHTGGKQWHEADNLGNTRFYFQEQSRDEWSVYLHDASRNVSIQLDLHRKKVLYGTGNQPKTDLYNITYFSQ